MAKDIVVIGGGPAGIEAALAAAPHARSVRLVAAAGAGDWRQLLPSRVWLDVLDSVDADLLKNSRTTAFDLKRVAARVERVSASWRAHAKEKLEKNGVEVLVGRAAFESATAVRVHSQDAHAPILPADAAIVAAGSAPFFPPGLEPDGLKVFSPDTLDRLDVLPRSMLVVGDSCIGFEFVDIFTRLGVEVTWIVLPGGPLSGFGAEVDSYFLDIFKQRGLRIEAGPPIVLERGDGVAARRGGDRFEADAAFVTIGQRPDLAPLNLAAAGLAANEHGLLATDAYGRTRTPGVYAVGGALRFGPGNFAMAQARIAALHAAGQAVSPFEPESTVVWFGLDPQAAKVGAVDSEDGSLHSAGAPYAAALSSHIRGDTAGFVRVAWDGSGRVVGGTAAGRHAAHALSPVALAVRLRASIDDLAGMQGAHPGVGELPYIAARQRS